MSLLNLKDLIFCSGNKNARVAERFYGGFHDGIAECCHELIGLPIKILGKKGHISYLSNRILYTRNFKISTKTDFRMGNSEMNSGFKYIYNLTSIMTSPNPNFGKRGKI